MVYASFGRRTFVENFKQVIAMTHIRLLRPLTLPIGALAMLVATVLAVPQAQAGPCASPSNWGSYVGSAACEIGNLQFSNFGFLAGGTNPPTAAAIGVATITTPGDEGFRFNPSMNVTGTQTTDALLTFEVTGLNGTLIDDLSIFFNGSFAGPGSTSFTESYCTISATQGCNVFSVTNPPANFTKHIDIAPVNHLWISKDIIASGGGAGGQASISDVRNTFSHPVPEPASLALLGVALLGAGVITRRRRKSM